ncbi:hypothetical protein FPKKA176_contig00035-0005 [Flavobacterium psychrophilum]|jgi:hypothetical protein|nr:hypothetical protein FPN184_contig00027-0005 [Flavobacterium psychrophilum]GEJ49699.1 hypothetical protein FPKKA176_contig00035-0005 [Flavobacterium psychrophilum]
MSTNILISNVGAKIPLKLEIFTINIKGKIIYPIRFTHFPCVSIAILFSLNNQNNNLIDTNKEARISPKSVDLFSVKKQAKIKYNKPAISIAGIFGKNIKLQNSRTVCNINTPKSNKNDSLE